MTTQFSIFGKRFLALCRFLATVADPFQHPSKIGLRFSKKLATLIDVSRPDIVSLSFFQRYSLQLAGICQ
jgi:hypothetical protein